MSLSLIAAVTLCAFNVAAASVSKPATTAIGSDITGARAAQSTTLTFTAPANVKLNQSFQISGSLTSASGTGIAGAVVDEEQYYNGTWYSMGYNVTTDNSGHLSDTWQLPQAGAYSFRLAYYGNSQNAASVSNAVTITAA